jgi:hypothetical protein
VSSEPVTTRVTVAPSATFVGATLATTGVGIAVTTNATPLDERVPFRTVTITEPGALGVQTAESSVSETNVVGSGLEPA